MGAKTWMIVHADANAREALAAKSALDREATLELATGLFPKEKLLPIEDGNLSDTCPADREICVGRFSGVSVVAAKEFGIERPSTLSARYIPASGVTILHAMHSVVDWFAYAFWNNGKLVRSLSLSPEKGIIENKGARMDFEIPYWAGKHKVVDSAGPGDNPFPFHPLDLGEAALKALLGYQLEGAADPKLLEPESITLARYRKSRSIWGFWR